MMPPVQALSSSPMFRFDGLRSGIIEEVTSPDDNLQAVFKYLVKP